MRKIKFRAYSHKYKELGMCRVREISIDTDGSLSGNVEGFSGEELDIGRVYFNKAGKGGGLWTQDDDVFMLMQYTELKDKNGIEIYEGDIVKVASRITGQIIHGKIIFLNGCFAVDYLDGSYNTHILCEFGKVEIIGSIYTTPELLKEGD